MKNCLTAAAAIALSAGAAMAASDADFRVTTGGSLATLCGAGADSPNYVAAIHMCQGYFSGVDQFHTAMTGSGGSPIYCLPATGGPSRDQAAAAFVAWVNSDPAAASMPAVEALAQWAATTYPCK